MLGRQLSTGDHSRCGDHWSCGLWEAGRLECRARLQMICSFDVFFGPQRPIWATEANLRKSGAALTMWVANAHNVIGDLGEGAMSPMACIIARHCSHVLISGIITSH